MTKARTLADFNTTNINPALLDDTGTIPSALLAGVGGGTVVQAKHYNFASPTTKNSAGGDGSVHTGCYITPTSASNKILVIVSAMIEGAGGINDHANVDLYRDNTNIQKLVNALGYGLNAAVRNVYTLNYLDDPQTTSQVEYLLNHTNTAGSTDYYYQVTNYTLLEIAA